MSTPETDDHMSNAKNIATAAQRSGRGLALATALLTLTSTAGTAAQNVEKAIVFPFELIDSAQEGELFPKIRPEETKRLALLTEDLKTRLSELNRFELIPSDSIAAEIKTAAPLHRCNGCEADLAKKAGAELGVLGVVQKFSDTLLSVNIQIIDSATGAVRKTYSAGIQGNTDEAWLRGTSYIVRNRIAKEDTK